MSAFVNDVFAMGVNTPGREPHPSKSVAHILQKEKDKLVGHESAFKNSKGSITRKKNQLKKKEAEIDANEEIGDPGGWRRTLEQEEKELKNQLRGLEDRQKELPTLIAELKKNVVSLEQELEEGEKKEEELRVKVSQPKHSLTSLYALPTFTNNI